jgi:hypothetical protein
MLTSAEIQAAVGASGAYGEVRNGQLYGPGPNGVNDARELTGFYKAGSQRKKRVNEAMRLYLDTLQGRVGPEFLREAIFPRTEYIVKELQRQYPGLYGDVGGRTLGLRETMSVTDYQALYVDVLDRKYYGYYNDWPANELALVKSHDLRDFRLVSRYLQDGVVSPMTGIDPAAPAQQRALTPPVPQDAAVGNSPPVQYQPLLYQAMASINWRAFVNDDLGIFDDVPRRLAMSARMTVAKFITSFLVSSSGLNSTLYQSAYNNLITLAAGASINNPPFGAQGMMDALKILASMTDSAGNPILVTGRLKVWFGPSLVAVANNLKKAMSVMLSVEGGTQNAQGFPTQFLNSNPDWLFDQMDLVLCPWLPIVNTGASSKTAWGVIVDPGTVMRPAIEMGWLQGFKDAQLFSKVPNTQRLGGGVDAMMGDFNTMDNDVKIVTVFGGTVIDGRTTVASTGQSV